MGENKVYDLIVVGGGPGGYTAALYAARAGLSTLVLEKLSAGGQMALTEAIDNYPGFEDGIDGFTLGEKMQRQAERFGAETAYAQVERVDLTASPKVLETSEGIFLAKTVVLATGANPRELGVPENSMAAFRRARELGYGVGYQYGYNKNQTYLPKPYQEKRFMDVSRAVTDLREISMEKRVKCGDS